MTSRPKLIAVAIGGGLVNVAIVFALLARGGSSALDTTAGTIGIAVPAFLFGALALGITAYAGLVIPTAWFGGLVGGVTYADLRSPPPESWQMGEYIVRDGPLYASYYATRWEVLLSLLLVASVAEFGLRRGYDIGGHRLRNLPLLPLSRRRLILLTTSVGGLLGVSTFALTDSQAMLDISDSLVIVAGAGAVTAVPLAALLSRGLVLPLLLYLAVVPRFLLFQVFALADSYVQILALGPFALVLLLTWALEQWLRSHYRRWEGEPFVNRARDP